MSRSDCGCREYRDLLRGGVSRRTLLRGSGLLLGGAIAPSWLPRVALAREPAQRDVLVSIFLRGGADGLSLCVPHFEPNYYRLRPSLAVARPDSSKPNRAIDLDGRFGLAPGFSALRELWDEGALAIVHACGSRDPTRSHFEAMQFMEAGVADRNELNGWLGRHLQMTAPTVRDAVLRAVGIGHALPLTLGGAPDTVPAFDLAAYGLRGDATTLAERRALLEEVYAVAEELLAEPARATFRTADLLAGIDFADYRPAGEAVYAEGEAGMALRSSAALIKADLGVEAIAIDAGGWDTHDRQGTTGGQLEMLLSGLGDSLRAFWTDLAADGRTDVTVVVMSEFGRNAFENGSGGTDHGHGGVMLVLGGAIRGGRVVTEWPGLETGQLYEGQDLDVTIDYRDILAEILAKRLGNTDHLGIFGDPTYVPVERGVIA